MGHELVRVRLCRFRRTSACLSMFLIDVSWTGFVRTLEIEESLSNEDE